MAACRLAGDVFAWEGHRSDKGGKLQVRAKIEHDLQAREVLPGAIDRRQAHAAQNAHHLDLDEMGKR